MITELSTNGFYFRSPYMFSFRHVQTLNEIKFQVKARGKAQTQTEKNNCLRNFTFSSQKILTTWIFEMPPSQWGGGILVGQHVYRKSFFFFL